MEPGKPPFKKRIFIKNYNEFKDKINQKAKYLVDDFKKGDKYVTQRVRQMMVTSQDYIRQKDIQGKMRKIDWVKGVKALILILIIFGAIASQNPVLFKTVVQAVVVATNDMKNLAGLKAILPVFRTIFTSLGSIEKIMIFVNILNVIIDDIPKAVTTWKYDKTSLSSYTREALKGTLTASKVYESIKYTDNKEEQDKKQAKKTGYVAANVEYK